MKIKKEHLLKSAKQPCAIASGKVAIPIMSHILISHGEGCLVIRAGNAIESCETRCNAEGAIPSLCINGSKFISVIERCKNDDVEITADSKDLLITAGNTFKMPFISADEFPKEPAKGALMELPAKIIAQGISKTLWAASEDVSRQVLCSVHIQLANKRLLVEAVNGRDGAFFIELLTEKQPINVVIPSECCVRLSEFLTEESASIYIGDGNLFVDYASGFYSCQLIAQSFPGTESVIGAKEEKVGVIKRDEWLACFGTISGLMQDAMTATSKFVKAVCCFKSKEAKITAASNSITLFNDSLPGDFPKEFMLNISATAFEKCLSAFEPGAFIALSVSENGAVMLRKDSLLVVSQQLRG